MHRPVPYEHRGDLYRQLRICNEADARAAARLFKEENDIWLKKILALKMIEALDVYDCGMSVIDLQEVARCRIK
jgi:hypothetical protein